MDKKTNRSIFQKQLINLASNSPAIYESANAWFIEQGVEITPVLISALEDTALGSVCHWRIMRILQYFGKEETLPALLKAFSSALQSRNSVEIHGAMEALSVFNHPLAIRTLLETLKEDNLDVAKRAAALLGKVGDASAIEPLQNLLKSDNSSLRYSAVRGLSQFENPLAWNILSQHLKIETDSEIRAIIMSDKRFCN